MVFRGRLCRGRASFALVPNATSSWHAAARPNLKLAPARLLLTTAPACLPDFGPKPELAPLCAICCVVAASKHRST